MTRQRDDLLTGVKPPVAPPALRSRVLAAARSAALEQRPAVSLIDRLWASRGLRLAWAAAILILLVINLQVLLPGAPPQRTAAAWQYLSDLDQLDASRPSPSLTLGATHQLLPSLLPEGPSDSRQSRSRKPLQPPPTPDKEKSNDHA